MREAAKTISWRQETSEMVPVKETEYTIEDIRALPEGERAELIDGQMYMMAAPSSEHQALVTRAVGELYAYIKQHGGDCSVFSSPFAVFLGDNQDYLEPDVTVVCDPSKIRDDGCHGAPDLVLEVVSASSRRQDYFTKLFKYRAEGVREYWIVDPMKNRVMVYRFSEDEDHEDIDVYSLWDAIPVGICGDLTITLKG